MLQHSMATSLGTIPEDFSMTAVYTCPPLTELPATVYAERPTFSELVWDAEGGFTDNWRDRSALTGGPGAYVFLLGRRAFSAAGLAVFAAGSGGGGGGGTGTGTTIVVGPLTGSVVDLEIPDMMAVRVVHITGDATDIQSILPPPTGGGDPGPEDWHSILLVNFASTPITLVSGGSGSSGAQLSTQGSVDYVLEPYEGVLLSYLFYVSAWTVHPMAHAGGGGGGSGNVVGPASSVDSHLAAFDGTTGELLEDSGVTTASVTAAITRAADAGWKKVVDTNFTQLANQTLTNGAQTIDGISYLVSGVANSSSFGVVNGTGLRIQCNANSSANYFLDASTGPVLAINLRTLCPKFVVGQSELRMWALQGNNGNANHENCGFGFALYPWNGGLSTTNWYQILAMGAYDSLSPHNGIICGHGSAGNPASRVDKDLTGVTVANDPTRSLWGAYFKHVGQIGFYTRSLGASANNTDPNDTVNIFEDMLLRAELKHTGQNNAIATPYNSGFNDNQLQYLLDHDAQWRANQADDVQLLICSLSTYNTSAHLLHTLKRLVVEVKY